MNFKSSLDFFQRARPILYFALLMILSGCSALTRFEVTSSDSAANGRYEVDVLEVFDDKMLSELSPIKNGSWFREKRQQYLQLNRSDRFFIAHRFLYQPGTPIKFQSRKRSRGILVFYRSNQLVSNETKPEQFPSKRSILISLGSEEAVNLLTPKR